MGRHESQGILLSRTSNKNGAAKHMRPTRRTNSPIPAQMWWLRISRPITCPPGITTSNQVGSERPNLARRRSCAAQAGQRKLPVRRQNRRLGKVASQLGHFDMSATPTTTHRLGSEHAMDYTASSKPSPSPRGPPASSLRTVRQQIPNERTARGGGRRLLYGVIHRPIEARHDHEHFALADTSFDD